MTTSATHNPAPNAERDTVVYIVDDDVSVRESLQSMIRHSGFQVETFSSAGAFLDRPRAYGPSCLILDVTLPGLNGLELQQCIAAEQASMPIIFITGHGDVPMSVRAMKAGAFEFLTKPFPGDVLLSSIRSAIARSRSALCNDAALQSLRARYTSLTKREREVMGLVVSGLMNKQIGGSLGTSEITVKAHRGKVMRKMQAESLADLVRMGQRLAL
jgi:FixJ family two-component response regulator